ncbi:MAG: AraC family transcriptional regulator [Saprospiraceae bacterium]|nr:AraC family transcriptional regulator [Saprospiraceae bacterium]
MTIYIKNMVSESCKFVVGLALEEMDIQITKIDLGEVKINRNITNEEKNLLNLKINQVGLEILEKENDILVDKIKIAIINYVDHSEEKPSLRFSAYLSEKLKLSYGYLANSFSAVEGTNIEQYLANVKVERIKELILLDELTLSQIAFKLHYCSVAHLSKQFKKVTGLTLTQFKALKEKGGNRL